MDRYRVVPEDGEPQILESQLSREISGERWQAQLGENRPIGVAFGGWQHHLFACLAG